VEWVWVDAPRIQPTLISIGRTADNGYSHSTILATQVTPSILITTYFSSIIS
jgi:hypothetical protein